jgi:hypothetical protein
MLAEQQFMEWFMFHGIDIGVPFPLPLVGRLCRSAMTRDSVLHGFLGESFTAHRKYLLVLKFKNWQDAFESYTSYGATFPSPLKA